MLRIGWLCRFSIKVLIRDNVVVTTKGDALPFAINAPTMLQAFCMFSILPKIFDKFMAYLATYYEYFQLREYFWTFICLVLVIVIIFTIYLGVLPRWELMKQTVKQAWHTVVFDNLILIWYNTETEKTNR